MSTSGNQTTFLPLLLLSVGALLVFLHYVFRVLSGLPSPLPEFALLLC